MDIVLSYLTGLRRDLSLDFGNGLNTLRTSLVAAESLALISFAIFIFSLSSHSSATNLLQPLFSDPTWQQFLIRASQGWLFALTAGCAVFIAHRCLGGIFKRHAASFAWSYSLLIGIISSIGAWSITTY